MSLYYINVGWANKSMSANLDDFLSMNCQGHLEVKVKESYFSEKVRVQGTE